jgi:hypothetical protein
MRHDPQENKQEKENRNRPKKESVSSLHDTLLAVFLGLAWSLRRWWCEAGYHVGGGYVPGLAKARHHLPIAHEQLRHGGEEIGDVVAAERRAFHERYLVSAGETPDVCQEDRYQQANNCPTGKGAACKQVPAFFRRHSTKMLKVGFVPYEDRLALGYKPAETTYRG